MALFWTLNREAQWHMLSQRYPNYKMVHRYFQHWCRNDVLRGTLYQLSNTLRESRAIDEYECLIDASFSPAKDEGDEIGTANRGKGLNITSIDDRNGLPLAVTSHAANHHEVTLVQLTFDFYIIEAKLEKPSSSKAYDSARLIEDLKKDVVEMIAQRKKSRILDKAQNGRELHCYKHRWIVE